MALRTREWKGKMRIFELPPKLWHTPPLSEALRRMVPAGEKRSSIDADEEVYAKSQSWIWGSVADMLAVLAALIVAFVGDSRSGAETQAFLAMERCMGLLAAMYFLFSSAGKAGHGLVQAVLSHASLASLGKYTLYVYLFQEPLFRSIDMLVPLKHSAEGFVFFVLLLWLIAGLYAENVEPLLLQMVYMHSPESRDELS
eukprot:s1619_g6.t1